MEMYICFNYLVPNEFNDITLKIELDSGDRFYGISSTKGGSKVNFGKLTILLLFSIKN